MTNAELAILSLIAEKPHHGYEIERVIDTRGMREWTEVGFSSIYYILSKLEHRGLVVGRPQPAQGRGPGRKVYRLTSAGRVAWRRAALAALAHPERAFSPFQLGLANLPLVPAGEAIQALKQYAQHLRNRRRHVRNRLTLSGQDLPFQAAAMFDLSLTMIEAELAWVQRFVRSFRASKKLRTANEQTGSDQTA